MVQRVRYTTALKRKERKNCREDKVKTSPIFFCLYFRYISGREKNPSSREKLERCGEAQSSLHGELTPPLRHSESRPPIPSSCTSGFSIKSSSSASVESQVVVMDTPDRRQAPRVCLPSGNILLRFIPRR